MNLLHLAQDCVIPAFEVVVVPFVVPVVSFVSEQSERYEVGSEFGTEGNVREAECCFRIVRS